MQDHGSGEQRTVRDGRTDRHEGQDKSFQMILTLPYAASIVLMSDPDQDCAVRSEE